MQIVSNRVRAAADSFEPIRQFYFTPAMPTGGVSRTSVTSPSATLTRCPCRTG